MSICDFNTLKTCDRNDKPFTAIICNVHNRILALVSCTGLFQLEPIPKVYSQSPWLFTCRSQRKSKPPTGWYLCLLPVSSLCAVMASNSTSLVSYRAVGFARQYSGHAEKRKVSIPSDSSYPGMRCRRKAIGLLIKQPTRR
jgi:hypothetical protein